MDEHGAKESLNTPGGQELLKRVGGPSGLPFYAFLDERGGLIVNSIRIGDDGKPTGNIGHPDKAHEIIWFLKMAEKTPRRMTPDELSTLEEWLKNQKR